LVLPEIPPHSPAVTGSQFPPTRGKQRGPDSYQGGLPPVGIRIEDWKGVKKVGDKKSARRCGVKGNEWGAEQEGFGRRTERMDMGGKRRGRERRETREGGKRERI